MNKKGEEKIISVYWFIMLILVAGGIFLMVSSFYNYPYDVREAEAEILSEKLASCIYSGGKFNPELMHISDTQISFKEEFRDNFLDKCDLILDGEDSFDKIQYYIQIDFFKVESFRNMKGKLNKVFSISEGNPNWISDCNFKEESYGRLVFCTEKEFFAYANENNQYKVKIISMVRKTEQNVKI